VSLTDEDKQWITEHLNERFERVETTFTENLERVETALLTAFHKWSSPVEMRVSSHTAVLRAVDLELEAVADRVKKLEGK
jgi:hypothetical protein